MKIRNYIESIALLNRAEAMHDWQMIIIKMNLSSNMARLPLVSEVVSMAILKAKLESTR